MSESTVQISPAVPAAPSVCPSTLTFLYASINDMQAVIRALDAKLSVALVIFSIALTKFDVLYEGGGKFVSSHPRAGLVLVSIFFLAWAIGVLSAFLGLIAINNPEAHIEFSGISGAFYGGGLFPLKFLDSFFNRYAAARPKLISHQMNIPKDDASVVAELSFEQMKLAYIRAIKLRRVRTAFFALVTWISIGITCWLVTLSDLKL